MSEEILFCFIDECVLTDEACKRRVSGKVVDLTGW